jgi:hypothetical protein
MAEQHQWEYTGQQRWEYMTLTVGGETVIAMNRQALQESRDIHEALTAHGQEGWELDQIMRYPGSSPVRFIFILKRPYQ